MTHNLVSSIEAILNRNFHKNSDFVLLSTLIYERTHERISATTLRRLWGYSNERVKPSRFTLDVLSQFLLFRDYDDFCSKDSDGKRQSGVCLNGKIESSRLCVGQLLRMSWLPDRSCLLEHLGSGHFRVIEAQNTKLAVGDTFTCHLFINNESAYLDNLSHGGLEPMRYVAGLKSGVVVEKVEQMCGE